MLKALLLVGAGGCAGSILRYLVSLWLNPAGVSGFPAGTFLVNIAGSFFIGLVMGCAFRHAVSGDTRLLLATGLCGGFTTFSSFSYESYALIQNGEIGTAALYAGASLAMGLLAVVAGIWISLSLSGRGN